MTEASGAQVRHPVWRGVQAVVGLWLPADTLSAQQRSERLLRWWAPGCRAWRFERGAARGDLLRFEAERMLHCERIDATPLRRIGAHGLHAGPLTEREREQLAPADVRLVAGGRSIALDFGEGEALDLSLAIELDDYALHDSFVCDRALPKLGEDKLAGKRVRDLLGERIAPPSEERQRFLRALGLGGDAAGDRPGLGERALALRDRAAAWLLRRFPGLGVDEGGVGNGAGNGSAGAAGTRTGGIAARAPARPPQRWRAALARMAAASGAARLIGLRQGAYLRRLMEQFDRGDLLEALRHALPIDGDGSGSLGQAFGTPTPRADLRLSAQRGFGASIGAGDDVRELLRQRYRSAFERFDRQGQVDEAVFVLAELLNARQEALDYLLKHGRAAQAAELALGWDLPADAIIRLLLLAGDRERAVLVARRDDAFAAAVAMLEGDGQDEHALALRREWGRALAAQGRWLQAVDAVWPDADPASDSREQAGRWLQAAEAGGAELSARALVQRACLLPDTVEHYAARIEALADVDGPAGAREALGQALAGCRADNPALARIAARTLPALAADRAGNGNALDGAQLDRILRLTGDPWLAADVPRWALPAAPNAPLWDRREPLSIRIDEPAGVQAPLDLAALGEGRWLAAFGEAGVAVYDAGGRCLRRYAVPAHRLVLGDSGEVALALAKRESVWRIARLDLTRHGIDDLGAMPLQFFADRFDGIAWSVATAQRIVALDAGPPDAGARPLEVLWSVGDLGGQIVQARFLRHDELFLVAGRGATAIWHYRTAPQRALVSREAVQLETGGTLLDPHGAASDPRVEVGVSGRVRFSFRMQGRECAVELEPAEPGDCAAEAIPLARGFLVLLRGAQRLRAYLIRRGNDASARCVAQIDWPQARLRVREQEDRLVLFDDEDRAVAIGTDRSQVRRVRLQ